MDFISAIILGLVQGITEFLPISSTGHLIIVREFLDVDFAHSLAIDGVLHLSTTLAIIIYFWNDIWVLLQALIRKMGRLPTNDKDLNLLYALVVGTVPAVVLGLLFEDIISDRMQNTAVVASVLFVAAIFFMYTEWRYYLNPPQGALTVRKGFYIGLFQAMALIPGFSRSGSTLAGGMLLGLSRFESARFSFLLAIPITLGVGAKKLLELISLKESIDWLAIGLGALVSFIMALIVIHFFLSFIRKYTLWPFIWYSIILSTLVGYVAFFV